MTDRGTTRRDPEPTTDPDRPSREVAPPGPLSKRLGAASAEVRFAAAAVAALVLFAAVYGALVTTEGGQRIENQALLGSELRSAAEREASLERLAQINVAIFALAVVAVFGIGLARRRGGLGSLVAGLMLVSVVAAELLKDLLPRPELLPGATWILRNSYPSGSAAVAGAIAVGAFLVSPDRLRWAVLPIGAIYAAVIGDAIQTTGWHRLSDTVGATLLVIAVACGALAALARAGLVQPTPHGRVHRRIRGALLVAASVTLMIGILLLVLLAIFPLLTSPEGGRRAFLQTAFPFFGAGFTILALMLFAWVVEPFSLGSSRPAADLAHDPAEARAG